MGHEQPGTTWNDPEATQSKWETVKIKCFKKYYTSEKLRNRYVNKNLVKRSVNYVELVKFIYKGDKYYYKVGQLCAVSMWVKRYFKMEQVVYYEVGEVTTKWNNFITK